MQRVKDIAFLFAVLALLAMVFHAPVPPVYAQPGNGTVATLADITGTGAAVQISASGTARWVQFIAPTTNTAVVRCGDSNVSTSRGLPIAAGAGQFFPFQAQVYNLSSIYCYIANGDKISIALGQ